MMLIHLQEYFIFIFSTERTCGISRRQARYLLHSVTEVSEILRSELQRDYLRDIPLRAVPSNIAQNNNARCIALCRFVQRIIMRCKPCIPGIIFTLLVNLFLSLNSNNYCQNKLNTCCHYQY